MIRQFYSSFILENSFTEKTEGRRKVDNAIQGIVIFYFFFPDMEENITDYVGKLFGMAEIRGSRLRPKQVKCTFSL